MKTKLYFPFFLLGLGLSAVSADEVPLDIKRLTEQRDQAIEEINRKFRKELRKKRSEYARKRDSDVLRLIDELLADPDAAVTAASIVGEWVFYYRGQARKHNFREDGTFSGHFTDSNKAFEGTWEGEGDTVHLSVNGANFKRWATIRIGEDGTANYRIHPNNHEMKGKKL